MAARTVEVGTTPTKASFMAEWLYIAPRPMTLKAKVLLMTGETNHTVRLRPKPVAPVLEEEGMASGRCRHVAVEAKNLAGVAEFAVCLEFFYSDGAMDPLPLNGVVRRSSILTPNTVTDLTIARYLLGTVTIHAILHAWKHNLIVCPGLVLI
jgi:hypothetical protein